MHKSQKPKNEPSKELLYLGERIETARTGRGLTQQELADQCHRGLQHIQNIESGLVNPSFEVLSDVIHRLGISADTLFFPDITEQEKETKHLLNKLAACSENEQQIILKTLDCMAEQFLRRRYGTPEKKSE
jgi:transcriptional regulator with XRE-family HTH domain